MRRTNTTDPRYEAWDVLLDEWFVEAHVPDEGDEHIGHYHTAYFSGPNARRRAEEYTRWKNSSVA